MCSFTSFSFLLPTLLAVVVIAILLRSYLRNTCSLNHIVESCGGRGAGLGKGIIAIDGREIVLHYRQRLRNSPSKLQLSVAGTFYAHASFRRETATDSFAKGAGINQEITLNEPLADSELYIECEDRDFISRFLNTGGVRKALSECLQDFKSFEIAGNRCVLTKTPCDHPETVPSDFVQGSSAKLLLMAGNVPLPAPGERSATPATEAFRRLANFFVAVSVASLVLGGISMIWGMLAYEPVALWPLFFATLKLSLPLLAIFAWITFTQLRGRSTSLRTLLNLMLIAPGLILLGWGGAMLTNGAADTSLAQAYSVPVIQKSYSNTKSGRDHFLHVSFWKQDVSECRFHVSRNLYERIHVGDTCVMKARRGALGYEWVVDYACGSKA